MLLPQLTQTVPSKLPTLRNLKTKQGQTVRKTAFEIERERCNHEERISISVDVTNRHTDKGTIIYRDRQEKRKRAKIKWERQKI